MNWRWVREDVVLAVHDVQLAQHGGLDGVRDMNAIQAALARPQQLDTYGDPAPDVFDLAAAYAYGLAKNHGFADGNKRTAWIVARLFLLDNDIKIQFSQPDAIQAMLGVAGGTMEEAVFAQWLRTRQFT
ncbi:type II toxin-antitoxin system death-on-curing family toxin [Noviherbaspirillum sedimenti]|uniref:Type II toxin-antitoxin system death-on-curing family toxin n=1 Tax=Noviherbaspirillum sedimenti TaxID=2320865 RepID=A0A3A3G2X8_9BURK|nr:type II toxin-antitoxin system death-on-curing family toxin [Noviherbaspirillum sedimenti]RJG02025.1 type II toxin-antitoxin system death-on-curing family toxin [Noviherbaspirillum sedimenti]